MGVLSEHAKSYSGKCDGGRQRSFRRLFLALAFVTLLCLPGSTWALQRHDLSQGGTTHAAPSGGILAGAGLHGQPGESQAGHAMASTTAGSGAAGASHGQEAGSHGPAAGQASSHGADAQTVAPGAVGHAPAGGAETGHGAAGEHGAPGAAHEAHGPPLPEISPIPGLSFVEAMINLMEHELKGRFLGWRPNDILIGRCTDNVNNYQLGVLEAMRFTTLRLKDSLTRMGDADTYDPDLEAALNLFMNKADLFWFPSAESSYQNALDHLKRFVEKLRTGKRSFYYRKDNLVLLFASYRDLLGNVNKSLIIPMDWFKSDDAFYYAKGVAHVYYEILRVARVGFEQQLATTLYAKEILDEVIHELHRVEEVDPWIILDADLGGFFANHRANLNAPLSEVTHLLVILSQL
ncbi:MAG: DUF2333 family protein [Deltaproteobacteria bacterium]|nr:DUF2333 family protein [Deltaproteobacteria bacterium]